MEHNCEPKQELREITDDLANGSQEKISRDRAQMHYGDDFYY
jgi:hypothetical protein